MRKTSFDTVNVTKPVGLTAKRRWNWELMSILSQDWTTEKWAYVVKALVRLLHKSAKKEALNVKIYKKNTSCQI